MGKQHTLSALLTGLNQIIEIILIKHEDFGSYSGKIKGAKKNMTLGLDIYLFSVIETIRSKVYTVLSQNSRVLYKVDIYNWFCSCPSFGQNGYTCKHMFGCLFKIIKDRGLDYEDYSTMNPFMFLRRVRKMIVNDPLLKKVIDLNEFPITIGEDSFEEIKITNKILKKMDDDLREFRDSSSDEE